MFNLLKVYNSTFRNFDETGDYLSGRSIYFYKSNDFGPIVAKGNFGFLKPR